jgi:hypothetical protein
MVKLDMDRVGALSSDDPMGEGADAAMQQAGDSGALSQATAPLAPEDVQSRKDLFNQATQRLLQAGQQMQAPYQGENLGGLALAASMSKNGPVAANYSQGMLDKAQAEETQRQAQQSFQQQQLGMGLQAKMAQIMANGGSVGDVATLAGITGQDKVAHSLTEEQIAEQGKYLPIKDAFGNVTSVLNTKSGEMTGANGAAAGLSSQGSSGGNSPEEIEARLQQVPPVLQNTVRGILAGKIPPPSPSSRSPAAVALLNAVTFTDHEFDSNDYLSRSKTFNSFKNGPDAASITAINTAIPHIIGLKQAYDNLNNGTWNEPTNSVMANINPDDASRAKTQAALADVNTHATAVSHELAKVFRNSGMAESDVKDWEKGISTSSTPASSDQTIKSVLDLLDGRLEALGNKFTQGTKQTRAGIDFLSPSAQAGYAKLRGTTINAPSGNAATPPAGNNPIDPTVAIQHAKDAIKAGADPTAIKQRLKAMNIDTSGF